jgi:hypothetical protein
MPGNTTPIPATTHFDYNYHAVNDRVADGLVGLNEKKQLVAITRFSDAHKGARQIIHMLNEYNRGYTLSLLSDVISWLSEQRAFLRRRPNGCQIEFCFL